MLSDVCSDFLYSLRCDGIAKLDTLLKDIKPYEGSHYRKVYQEGEIPKLKAAIRAAKNDPDDTTKFLDLLRLMEDTRKSLDTPPSGS